LRHITFEKKVENREVSISFRFAGILVSLLLAINLINQKKIMNLFLAPAGMQIEQELAFGTERQ